MCAPTRIGVSYVIGGTFITDDDQAVDEHVQLRDWAVSLIRRQPSVDGRGIADMLHRLCLAAVAGLGMSGAVVTLRSVDGPEAIAAATDGASRSFIELEFSLGEGPSRDAFARGRPVLVSQLGSPLDGSWPGYGSAAAEAGVAAVFAFPLQLGASRFGVLTLFRDAPLGLSPAAVSKCLVMSEIATEMLLDSAGATTDGEIDPDLKSVLGFRGEIYQAQGMVMASLGLGLPEALALMRAHAFVHGRNLVEVSVDIVEGRLQLTDDRAP